MKIAFYIGKGKYQDKFVRAWTKSKFSHCELIINDISYSSSPRDGGTRKKQIDYDSQNWLIFNLKDTFDINVALRFLNEKLGKKYDNLGIIFSQVFNLDKQDKNKYFCSELIAECLKRSYKNSEIEKYFFSTENFSYYSPERLFQYLKYINLLSDV